MKHLLAALILAFLPAAAFADAPVPPPSTRHTATVYTAFGGTYPSATVSGAFQRYTFTGRESSAHNSAGAPMYYRNRMYSAGLGRFGRRDPKLDRRNQYGEYAYAAGRPAGWVDPYGLESAPDAEKKKSATMERCGEQVVAIIKSDARLKALYDKARATMLLGKPCLEKVVCECVPEEVLRRYLAGEKIDCRVADYQVRNSAITLRVVVSEKNPENYTFFAPMLNRTLSHELTHASRCDQPLLTREDYVKEEKLAYGAELDFWIEAYEMGGRKERYGRPPLTPEDAKRWVDESAEENAKQTWDVWKEREKKGEVDKLNDASTPAEYFDPGYRKPLSVPEDIPDVPEDIPAKMQLPPPDLAPPLPPGQSRGSGQ